MQTKMEGTAIWIIFLFGFVSGDITSEQLLQQRNINNLIKIETPPVILTQYQNFAIRNSNVSFSNLLQIGNITIPDINITCTNFRTTANVSEECAEQLEIVCANSTLLMTMLDASAKFPYPGLGYSTRLDFGNYDQCLTIDHRYSGGRILGEYCTVGLGIPDIFGNLSDIDSYYKLAMCRPNACFAKDFNAILENSTSLSLGLFADGACITAETNTKLDGGDKAVLSIFVVVMTLMVLSTIYDVCLYLKGAKSQHPLLLSFSVLSNGRKLLHITKHPSSKEQIETFHGLRVISMMWIVAGHGVVMWQYIPVVNADRINTWQKEMTSLYIMTGPLAVDTFFFMSGFLLAFQYFKSKTRTLKEQVTSIPHIYLHRYLRLTPAMLMIYLVTITFFVRIGSGPIWLTLAENYRSVCQKYWWKYFLYIQNYNDTEDICLVQTWYLSADMQLFLFSPIVLIPLSLHLKKKGFKFAMLEMLIWNVFWTFLPMTTKLIFRDHEYYYDTHSRAINYFIGMMLGLFMRVKIEEPFLYMINEKRRSIVNLITWLVMILGMLATIICYQDQSLHHGYNSRAVFDPLMRPAWCIGLSWITYSCYHGQGGFVNWILCRPIFQVLGKLTYCIYLTHMAAVSYYIGTMRNKLYFTDYNAFYQFCGHYVISVILATFWTLAFESPLMILEKHLFGGAKKSKDPISSQNGQNGAPAKLTP